MIYAVEKLPHMSRPIYVACTGLRNIFECNTKLFITNLALNNFRSCDAVISYFAQKCFYTITGWGTVKGLAHTLKIILVGVCDIKQ